VNLRSGNIVKVEDFLRVKKPAFKVWTDFGPEIGALQTSAQVTVQLYTPDASWAPDCGMRELRREEYRGLYLSMFAYGIWG